MFAGFANSPQTPGVYAYDVKRYGTVIWEMATYGKNPFYEIRKGLPEVMKQVRGGLRLSFPPDFSPRLLALAQRCFALKPGDRPSFSEVGRELMEQLTPREAEVRDVGAMLNGTLEERLGDLSTAVTLRRRRTIKLVKKTRGSIRSGSKKKAQSDPAVGVSQSLLNARKARARRSQQQATPTVEAAAADGGGGGGAVAAADAADAAAAAARSPAPGASSGAMTLQKQLALEAQARRDKQQTDTVVIPQSSQAGYGRGFASVSEGTDAGAARAALALQRFNTGEDDEVIRLVAEPGYKPCDKETDPSLHPEPEPEPEPEAEAEAEGEGGYADGYGKSPVAAPAMPRAGDRPWLHSANARPGELLADHLEQASLQSANPVLHQESARWYWSGCFAPPFLTGTTQPTFLLLRTSACCFRVYADVRHPDDVTAFEGRHVVCAAVAPARLVRIRYRWLVQPLRCREGSRVHAPSSNRP